MHTISFSATDTASNKPLVSLVSPFHPHSIIKNVQGTINPIYLIPPRSALVASMRGHHPLFIVIPGSAPDEEGYTLSSDIAIFATHGIICPFSSCPSALTRVKKSV